MDFNKKEKKIVNTDDEIREGDWVVVNPDMGLYSGWRGRVQGFDGTGWITIIAVTYPSGRSSYRGVTIPIRIVSKIASKWPKVTP